MAAHRDPIERKVQVTGGSTYTISMPKGWATERGIEAGTRLNIYTRGDRLVLTPTASDERRRSVTIRARDRDPTDLARRVGTAYVAGCEEIAVEDRPDGRQRRAVRDTLRGLVGIEIHAEDDERMVARTMLSVDDLSARQTLVQIQQLALLMHEDAVAAVVAGDSEAGRAVQSRDDDVDRLFGLVCREFHLSLAELAVAQRRDGPTTFEYYTAARQLERIADHAEKIASVAVRAETTPPEDIAERLDELAGRSREVVRRAFSGTFGDDGPDLGRVVSDGHALVDDAAAVDRELYERGLEGGYLLGTVLDSIVRTAEYGINVAEAGLRAGMRDHDHE